MEPEPLKKTLISMMNQHDNAKSVSALLSNVNDIFNVNYLKVNNVESGTEHDGGLNRTRSYNDNAMMASQPKLVRSKSSRPRSIRRFTSHNGLVRHGGAPQGMSRDRKLTWISLYIMLMYLICHIWKFIPNVYDAIYGFVENGSIVMPDWPKWLHVIKDLSHIMVVLNSAFNFLPYLWIKSGR